jgi:RimJ/RimL family protein N-acetyltransferase
MLTDPFHVSREEQKVWFEKLSQSRSSRRYAIIFKETNIFCGVVRIDRIDLVNKSAEIGADISPHFRRQGLAFEAYLGLIEYLFQGLGLHRLQLVTRPDNQAAVSLYEKIGFTREGILSDALFRNGSYSSLILMSLLSHEWRKPDSE